MCPDRDRDRDCLEIDIVLKGSLVCLFIYLADCLFFGCVVRDLKRMEGFEMCFPFVEKRWGDSSYSYPSYSMRHWRIFLSTYLA